jgi:hypothetical protein
MVTMMKRDTIFKYLVIPCVALWGLSNTVDLDNVLCGLPVVSRLQLCVGRTPSRYIRFRTLMELQSTAFAQLAVNAAEGASVGSELTRMEMASSKLSVLLQNSDKLVGTEFAAQKLMMLSENVRKVARGLQLFNSEVSGAIEK